MRGRWGRGGGERLSWIFSLCCCHFFYFILNFFCQVEEARFFVRRLAQRQVSVAYLHFAEGAPQLGGADGPRAVGKALAYLAADFVECREERRRVGK
jgi:hypothetical protein